MKYILLTILLYAACDNEYQIPEDTIHVDTVWVDSVNVPLE